MKTTKRQQQIFITTEQNGFDMLTRNISRNKYLSKGAKALYIYLNSHNENFNLSIESIAKFFNESESTIKREMKELKENGFLILEKKENSNCYYYKLQTSPKLEYIKAFTTENIIRALMDNVITYREIVLLMKKKYISYNRYLEIINTLHEKSKKEWIDDD